jgi:uncharacterized PurR-regulated membrane protein YhhQ (DUF165 family)
MTSKGNRMRKTVLFVAFVATVYGANWALARWGLVPVGLGLMAPAGVYFAGLAFGLRDALHEVGGSRLVLGAIATGAALSYVIEDAVTIPGGHVSIAVASAVAFGLSELADLCIYSPLRERNWVDAVVASNLVGGLADSMLFLWLAFGSVDNIGGLLLGKAWTIAPALLVVAWARRRNLDQGPSRLKVRAIRAWQVRCQKCGAPLVDASLYGGSVCSSSACRAVTDSLSQNDDNAQVPFDPWGNDDHFKTYMDIANGRQEPTVEYEERLREIHGGFLPEWYQRRKAHYEAARKAEGSAG